LEEFIVRRKIKQEIFLNDLPRWEENEGRGNPNTINWNKSVGYTVKGIYDNIDFEVTIIKYIPKTHTLTILYKNKEFKISTDSFKECALGKILGKVTSNFKIKNGTRFVDDKRDIIIIDREYRPTYKSNGKLKQNKKYYKYKCNKCGYTGYMEENNILINKNGCLCCSGKILVQGINDIPTTAPWLIPYFQGGYDEAKLYTKYGSGNPDNAKGLIQPICKDCGRIKNKKISISGIYLNHSIGCSCGKSISYPNKFAYNFLEQQKVNFIAEYSPKWISPKRYDFYFEINKKIYILEMDGKLGPGENNYKSKISVEESKAIDDYKDEQAKLHGIEVIRIDCKYENSDRFEYIKKNISENRKLNELFDLSKINWNKVEEFSLSNLVKTICEYKSNNPDMTTTEIGNVFKLSNTTIASYLKKGNIYGWCVYIGYEEFIKNNLRNSEKNKLRNGKSVTIFKDNVYLGKFITCKELENKSKQLFGIKLDAKSISAVANGTRKTYMGYVFKYVDNLTLEEYIKYNI
jgi:hypothetical protein